MHKLLLALLITAPTFAATCESLNGLALKGGSVTLAQTVAAGQFAPAQGNANAFKTLPAFCRVAATLKPTADSDIKIEVWLPIAGWNNSLQSVGNGAWAGSIAYPAMATALAAGFATASTDTGHVGGAGDFMIGHPEKLVDFGYRAVHEMTVAAKATIAGYYGKAPSKSYWNGCSTGGRQALMEAQKYPEDYDGILAGAPAIYASHLQAMQVWAWTMSHPQGNATLPAAKLPAIHKAALEACDAADGVKDGVIENPLKCKFDPASIECKGAESDTCLTAPQVAVARNMYAGMKDATGKSLSAGVEPGSETGWNMLAGNRVSALADELYRNVVKADAKWDSTTLGGKDVVDGEKMLASIMDANDPNIKPFLSRGGKLLIYHGWADPGVPPENTISYYNRMRDTVGKQADDSVRLFLVPGMGHCRGGDGTDTFDGMAALAAWAEKNQAPARIEASHATQGKVDKTRPLCPFPQQAVYNGSGSTDESANFSCKVR